MESVAIVIWSEYGQTAKIAGRIRERLAMAGVRSQVFQLGSSDDLATVPLDGLDGAIVGSPVYIGKFSRVVIEWTKKNSAALNALPTAFFSVSLNAADARPEAREVDRQLIASFLDATGLNPRLTASLIGTVHYRKYGLLKRWLLRRICAAAGGPTDTSRDHELTDWQRVDDFADEFVGAMLKAKHAPTASVA